MSAIRWIWWCPRDAMRRRQGHHQIPKVINQQAHEIYMEDKGIIIAEGVCLLWWCRRHRRFHSSLLTVPIQFSMPKTKVMNQQAHGMNLKSSMPKALSYYAYAYAKASSNTEGVCLWWFDLPSLKSSISCNRRQEDFILRLLNCCLFASYACSLRFHAEGIWFDLLRPLR